MIRHELRVALEGLNNALYPCGLFVIYEEEAAARVLDLHMNGDESCKIERDELLRMLESIVSREASAEEVARDFAGELMENS